MPVDPGERDGPGHLSCLAARFTASVAKLTRRAGSGSRALKVAAVGGGGVAAASLAASAAYWAALAGPSGREEDSAATLARRAFIAGGGARVGFGVLVGALGLAGLRTRGLPLPLSVTAVASASASLLSPLYFVAEPAGWLIPVGRISGLIVSGVAGVRLARKAHSRAE